MKRLFNSLCFAFVLSTSLLACKKDKADVTPPVIVVQPPVTPATINIAPQEFKLYFIEQISISDKGMRLMYVNADSVIVKATVTYPFYVAHRSQFVLGSKIDFQPYCQCANSDDYFVAERISHGKDVTGKDWVSILNENASGLTSDYRDRRKVVEMMMPLSKFKTYVDLKVGTWLNY